MDADAHLFTGGLLLAEQMTPRCFYEDTMTTMTMCVRLDDSIKWGYPLQMHCLELD